MRTHLPILQMQGTGCSSEDGSSSWWVDQGISFNKTVLRRNYQNLKRERILTRVDFTLLHPQLPANHLKGKGLHLNFEF